MFWIYLFYYFNYVLFKASIINMVMSCALVIAKSMDEKQNTEYTALVYAVLNSFDIDELDYFVVTKWLKN